MSHKEITSAMRKEAERLRRNIDGSDPKDWARRIIAKHIDGQRIAPCTLLFAKQALKLVKE